METYQRTDEKNQPLQMHVFPTPTCMAALSFHAVSDAKKFGSAVRAACRGIRKALGADNAATALQDAMLTATLDTLNPQKKPLQLAPGSSSTFTKDVPPPLSKKTSRQESLLMPPPPPLMQAKREEVEVETIKEEQSTNSLPTALPLTLQPDFTPQPERRGRQLSQPVLSIIADREEVAKPRRFSAQSIIKSPILLTALKTSMPRVLKSSVDLQEAQGKRASHKINPDMFRKEEEEKTMSSTSWLDGIKKQFDQLQINSKQFLQHYPVKARKSTSTRPSISGPSSFEHVSHIGLDKENGGFEIRNIPKEWESFFSIAGVVEADLHDRPRRRLIAHYLHEAGLLRPVSQVHLEEKEGWLGWASSFLPEYTSKEDELPDIPQIDPSIPLPPPLPSSVPAAPPMPAITTKAAPLRPEKPAFLQDIASGGVVL